MMFSFMLGVVCLTSQILFAAAPVANPGAAPLHQIVSKGGTAGPYQAFPDACRAKDGSILAVFYAGYGHVSFPLEKPDPKIAGDWSRGGRICLVRSRDEGKTWSVPVTLFDGPEDDRDPHIAQLNDGRLVCSFFTYRKQGNNSEIHTCLVESQDGGEHWSEQAQIVARDWACSAPVRQLSNGLCLLGIYREWKGKAVGGVIRSSNSGKTWSAGIPIGQETPVELDAETDVVELKDGKLWAALRSSTGRMHFATSGDQGLTWSPAQDIGFKGHCPHLNRLSSGEIVMGVRIPNTSLYVSRNEAKTWDGPYQIDSVGGAYPATVELRDHTLLAIYYEEGAGSAIRVLHLKRSGTGFEAIPWK